MSEEFFGFDEDDDYGDALRSHRSRWRWITVAIVLVALIGCGLLCFKGIRDIEDAEQNESYAGHSWVMQGEYVNMTQDLQTKTYNGVYAGKLPSDIDQDYSAFDGGISDPKKVQKNGQVQFRGTQTGVQKQDFPAYVDALVTVDGDTLKVVRTTEMGTMSPVTQDGIDAQRRTGWLMVGAGAVVLLAGAAGAVYGVRRTRADED